MIEPLLADDALLADIASVRGGAGRMHLWWLGQSGFLLHFAGRFLLLDPYLSDSLTKKYAATDKPHVRMTRRAIAPERLDFVDVVTSSHNHTDHLDAETLLPLLAANPQATMIVPAANRAFAAERLGRPVESLVGLNDGESTTVGPFEIHAVPAAHDELEQDEHGRHKFLGYVVRCDAGAVYHSGDTRLYDGMAERLRPFRVSVALLPINGHAPERRVAGNLTGREAAELAHAIGARLAIPCHYDLFTFNTAPPDEFLAVAAALGQPTAVLRCGERWTSPAA